MADTLDEFIGAIGDTRILFWTCPNQCRGMVTWDKNEIATCGMCGRTNKIEGEEPKQLNGGG
jgi:hypothetical protein